jgi:hypothetical protein
MDVGAWVERFTARICEPIELDRPLTEDDVWGAHGPLLWRAPGFSGSPCFYPVYRWRDLYSHSPLALIVAKGRFEPNPAAIEAASAAIFDYVPAMVPIDPALERLGAPHAVRGGLDTIPRFVEALTEALKQDITRAEARHAGYKNVVLCGGKDSLNLLLLPWKNPVLVASAQPNTALVRQFVERNGLPFEVVELGDPYDSDLKLVETALGLGRANLEHWRWGGALHAIAEQCERRLIFWKGQVGDAYTTPKWRKLADRPGKMEKLARSAYTRALPQVPPFIDRLAGRALQPRFAEVTWRRCAALQGSHMDFIRELTDSLPLSAFHGPAMRDVLERAVLPPLTRRDIRFDIGERLFGRPVWYPEQNPAPPPSVQRHGRHHMTAVRESLATLFGMTEDAGIDRADLPLAPALL